jgi:hypothetical protein
MLCGNHELSVRHDALRFHVKLIRHSLLHRQCRFYDDKKRNYMSRAFVMHGAGYYQPHFWSCFA